MFDTHIHNRREAPRYPQEVHEHRAPTDDSIRLYAEMEQKARDSIILAISSKTNGFKYKAAIFDDQAHMRLLMSIWFWLNESEHRVQIELPNRMMTATVDEWTVIIRDEIAKKIATHIVVNSATEILVHKR